jgi:tetratricopeptide (TPR) repeat protein
MTKTPEEFFFTIGFDDVDSDLLPDGSREPGTDKFRTNMTSFLQEQYRNFGGKARIVVNDNDRLIEVRWTPDPSGIDPEDVVLDLLNRGQIEKAIPLIWTLIRQYPNEANHHYNLGMAYSNLGQLDKAQHYLKTALRLSPDHSNAQVALGVAQARARDLDTAIETLGDAVDKAPDNPWAHQNLAGCLLELGKPDKAEVHFRESLSILPDNPQVMYGLGQALEALGNTENADEVYQQIISIGGTNPAIEAAREARSKIAQSKLWQRGHERMDAVMYCVGALEKFGPLAEQQIRAIGFEIALLGRDGLDINDPTQKYTLKELPGEFSGLHLCCYMYVAFKHFAPEQDTGIDLSREYEAALSLHKKKT